MQDTADPDGTAAGRRWLAALPDHLDRHRRLLTQLLELCQREQLAASLSVGCSLGRGAADPFSDVDAALGVIAARGTPGAGAVGAVEQAVLDALPGHGPVVDVLRQRVGPPDRFIRRVFAQFHDGLQLDLAVLADTEVRRGGAAAPDFVALYRARTPARPSTPTARPSTPTRPRTPPPLSRSTTGRSSPGSPSPTPASTCDAAPPGRPTTACTKPATTSGRCGPPPPAPPTPGTDCPRSSTTTPITYPRESRTPSPASTPATCAEPPVPARRFPPTSASSPRQPTQRSYPVTRPLRERGSLRDDADLTH